MVTNNIRVVGYLPPPYHQKLREFMQSQALTESAALVTIVKQFFDGSTRSAPVANKELDDAMVQLKADMAKLERRLAVLEAAFMSGKHFKSAQRTSHRYGPPAFLPPQTITQLARRLGVSAATVEEAQRKGEDYFRDWSRRIDPAKRSWHKLGELFHPNAE